MNEQPEGAASPEAGRDQKNFVHEVDVAEQKFLSSPAALISLAAVAVLLVELIVSLIYLANVKSQIKYSQSRISDAKKVLETSEIKKVEKRATAILSGVKIYQRLKADSVDYLPLWNGMKKLVIPDTRLKTVSVEGGKTVKIQGEAKTYIDVSKLLAKMNKSDLLRNIKLVSLDSGETVKSFSINALYSAPKGGSSE